MTLGRCSVGLDGLCVKSGEGGAARVDEFKFGSSPGASPGCGARTTWEMQLDTANDDTVGGLPPTNGEAGFGSADQPENWFGYTYPGA